MTKEDLAEFEPEWVEPISTNYHGYDIFQLPPPGQGFAALEMLNILEVCVPKLGFNLAMLGPSNPMFWHLEVEAKKLAYADLLAKNGDPKFASVPVKELLSKEYAATLCNKINPNKASRRAARRSAGRNDLPHNRRSLGQHGVPHSQRVQRLRQSRYRAALRLRLAQSGQRVSLVRKAPTSSRPKAAVPQHHRRFHPKGRGSLS